MRYCLLGLGVLASLCSLHRLALWAERRGWIYYRKRRGSSGTLASAALEVQSLMEPSRRYVLQEKRRDRREDQDSGDPPSSGE